ncbi:MAG: hypothetical protein K6L76_13540 [Agarilytica sp.]
MGRIVKYIDKEFNPKEGCTTFRLGTLDHFQRQPEEDGIGDYLEGLTGIATKAGESVTITPESKGGLFPGLKKGVIKLGPGSSDGPAFMAKAHNCYIYCATVYDDWIIPDKSRFPKYDSKFEISNPNMFVSLLGKYFEMDFTLEDVDELSLARLSRVPASQANVSFYIAWQKVRYDVKKISEISQANVMDINHIPVDDQSKIFCKPEKYSYQKEIRFVIRPYNRVCGPLGVKITPKTIETNRLNEFLSILR